MGSLKKKSANLVWLFSLKFLFQSLKFFNFDRYHLYIHIFAFHWSTKKKLQKELSFCHKLRFSYSYNLATCFPRPLIFQTINSGRSSSLSLKYQRFTPSGCKDIGVRKYKFVAKTQFLRLELKKS